MAAPWPRPPAPMTATLISGLIWMMTTTATILILISGMTAIWTIFCPALTMMTTTLMATATTIQTTTVAFSSQRLSGSNDDDENSKKKSEESSFTSSSSSSSSQRIREATFLATFENFQSDFQRLKAKAIKARENNEEEYYYEEEEGEEEETTIGKKISSSSVSCDFCGPHSLG